LVAQGVSNVTLLAMKQRLQQWWLSSWPKIVVPSVLVGGIRHGYDEQQEPNSCARVVVRSVDKAFATQSTIFPTLLARFYYMPTVTLTEGATEVAATITDQSLLPHSILPFPIVVVLLEQVLFLRPQVEQIVTSVPLLLAAFDKSSHSKPGQSGQ
jgi:hypothetical protein